MDTVAEQVSEISIPEALVDAVLGYAVVFIGLILLMVVIIIVGKIMVSQTRKSLEKTAATMAAAPAAPVSAPVGTAPAAPKRLAPGSAGEVRLYDTDPRDAAMIMAIVADKMQKPLNELRFVSIKEVKE